MKKKFLLIITGMLMITSLVYGVKESDDNGFSEESWLREVESIDRSLFHAPHYNDDGYFNPWMTMNDIGFGKVIRWRFFSDKQQYTDTEESFLPQVQTLTAEYINSHDNFMSWIGHGSVLIKSAGTVILVDPVLGEIPFVENRKVPAALNYDETSRITGDIVVLVTHNHYDHLDKKSIRSMPSNTQYVVPENLGRTMKKIGASDINELDWWNELEINGIKIILLPSQHWSRRGAFDTNESLWGSFLVDTGRKKIFICGDSGYSLLYKEIAAAYPGIDYAFMSAGAFHPRWFMHYAHQDDAEAIRGFRELGAKKMIPFHWGSFRLGDEPAGYPALHIKEKFPGAMFVSGGEIINL